MFRSRHKSKYIYITSGANMPVHCGLGRLEDATFNCIAGDSAGEEK